MLRNQKTDWHYLGSEAFLVLVIAYVFVLGGTLTGLISYPVQLISSVLGVLIFGIWSVARLVRRQSLPRTGLERAWLFFIGAQVLAILFSDDPRRSLPAGLIWVLYALIFYLAYDLLRRGWPAELLEKCLLIAGAILVGLALYQLAGSFGAWSAATAGLQLAPDFYVRLSSAVGDPNLLAATLNLLLPLALTRALAGRNRFSQIVLVLMWAAGLAVVYFTDSRGGLLGFAMGFFVVGVGWVRLLSPAARQKVDEGWAWLRARRWLFYGLVVLVLVAGFLAAARVLGAEGDTTHAPVASARDIYWQAAAAAFRSKPLTGVGPGIYPVYLMQAWSTPPMRPYLHAHSTPFNIGAESGLLGFAALFILLGAIWKQAWRGWQHQDAFGQARWVGITAALAGLSLHSLVDDFLPFPVVGLILMLLLAIWLSTSRPKESAERIPVWWLALPGLVLLALSLYSLRGAQVAQAAVADYQRDDLGAAAESMQQAAELDPSFGFYWQQAGFSYGWLSQAAPVYTDLATLAYERAIAIEPVYGLNYVHLATLYAQQGLVDQALKAFQEAVGRAPESALLWLNQGAFLERQGDLEAAQDSYLLALSLEPEAAATAFWQRNEFRQGLLAAVQGPTGSANTSRQRATLLASAARAAIQAGDLATAESQLAEAYYQNDQDVSVYLGLAELAVARDDLDLAYRYLDASLLILTTSNQAKIEAVLLQAEILAQQGQSEQALERYQLAFDAITSRNLYGWGSRGWTPYSFFAFLRQGFPEDLLPQLERIDISIDIAERLSVLADLYEGTDEAGRADEVRAALAPFLP